MRNQLILMTFLLYSTLSFSCTQYCRLINQCNGYQTSAFSLRDGYPRVSFCRSQFVNTANRINEVCSALAEGRASYAKDILGDAITSLNAANDANCKPSGSLQTFIATLSAFRNAL